MEASTRSREQSNGSTKSNANHIIVSVRDKPPISVLEWNDVCSAQQAGKFRCVPIQNSNCILLLNQNPSK